MHQDPVTKSQRVTDTLGNVISTVDLDPWGGETSRSSNQAFQPHRYTTYERDSNGGDEAMMRRYHSYWNRFSQPDPYDGSYNLTDPQSFNRYSYTQNDPVNFVDPSGLDDDGLIWNWLSWSWTIANYEANYNPSEFGYPNGSMFEGDFGGDGAGLDPQESNPGKAKGVVDVHSSSKIRSSEGTPYDKW